MVEHGVGLANARCMARFTCVAALLAGCTSPNAKLADLPDLRIGVIVDREVDTDGDYSTRPSKVSIELAYDTSSFRAAHDGDCAIIDDSVSGSVNGAALSMDDAGDYDSESDECYAPHLKSEPFVLGVDEPGHVEFADATLAIAADFAGPGFGARVARPVSPTSPSWTLAAGQPFAFEWSHASDLVGITPDRVAINFEHGVYLGESFTITEVTETQIRGVAPAMPEYTGDGVLMILLLDATTDWDPATSCTGAAACNVTSYRLYEHSAQLTEN